MPSAVTRPGRTVPPITAGYDQGILKITIPVPEEAKPAARRIAVGHPS